MIKRKTINKAFTMAEILLVIAIIGVIATLTIPNINRDVDEQKYITLLKGTMSQVNAAIGAVIAEYATIENASSINCASGTTSGNVSCFAAKVADKMQVGLNCGTSVSDCMETSIKKIDGNTTSKVCSYAFTLSNGVSVCFANSIGVYYVLFDLDGVNDGFNTMGIDKHQFRVNNDGLYFRYGDERNYDASFIVGQDEESWAFYVGNMDYVKCYSSLKWQTKETCD